MSRKFLKLCPRSSGLWLKQGGNMGNMEKMASLFVFPPVRLEDLAGQSVYSLTG